MASHDLRNTKLRLHFRRVLSGESRVRNNREGKLFIESICSQSDPVSCVQILLSNTAGLKALQLALSADLSTDYLNDVPIALLRYIQEPGLKVVGGGQFLLNIVLHIVEPPIFWNAFLVTQRAGSLSLEATRCFAWLLLQLVLLPKDKATMYHKCAQESTLQSVLLTSFDSETRSLAQRIKHTLEAIVQPNRDFGDTRPGGRHDNDHENVNNIAILPTPDEISCTDDPFLRRAADIEGISGPGRLPMHIDNQFRLLREDMLRDLREEMPIALGLKKGRHRGMVIPNLMLEGVECDERNPWSVRLKCTQGLSQMPKSDEKKRKLFLKENRNFLRNGSLAYLLLDDDPSALVTIKRNEDLLAQQLSIICITFSDNEEVTSRVLLHLRLAHKIRLIQLNTAVFAYEPVLRQLQATNQMFLRNEIIDWTPREPLRRIRSRVLDCYNELMDLLKKDSSSDLQNILDLPSITKLDKSQAECFLAGISQRLSLVQGPPGTGKSFIGALMAKAIYRYSKQKILVVCYTNHALDQFLDDLVKVGIPGDNIVRLGSAAKASLTSKPLLLSAQNGSYKFTRADWEVLNARKNEARVHGKRMQAAFARLQASSASKTDVIAHLEFASGDPDFSAAFQVPEDVAGMTRVGKKGKGVDEFYLLDQWAKGRDAGIFAQELGQIHAKVWQMGVAERTAALRRWKTSILQGRVEEMLNLGRQLNEALVDIETLYQEKERRIIQEKRIIGCTTTGAAKLFQSIRSASPDILLVEEAGEILESHILTALGPEMKQAILIGDHKQLRPKAHYDLSVEKGDGYDLNRSLFERLILKGYPHQTLSEQHRMRPEISSVVRHLTYPDLTDAPSTMNRPSLRGFQDNLIFVNHAETEEEAQDVLDGKDQTSPSSKRNIFEAEMTLKCIRYLAQQGYGTDKIVVLTPYVAQLRLLYDVLGQENDPVLNDLDSYDLVRAGLMPAATAKQLKRPLCISTIDNYQGEESDIVVVSLTRSNASGDIGFLSQPERLNVMLSRARNGMIVIGNFDTFTRSRKGKVLWEGLLELLKSESHIYDGFPVQCERHQDRKSILSSPQDFDRCPDGGCNEPCTTRLKCGIHDCPQRCHQLYDHSKMQCKHILNEKCSIGHAQSWECHASKPIVCKVCEKKMQIDEKKQREAFERQKKREIQEQEHTKQMVDLEDQIHAAREQYQDHQRSQELTKVLDQKKCDLENSKKKADQALRSALPPLPGSKVHIDDSEGLSARSIDDQSHQSISHSTFAEYTKISAGKLPLMPQSASEDEWERMKRNENVASDALDSLMKMTGLERVKQQFLTIKAKIDTTQRQGTDLKKDRFGVVCLGNPGTGKTTVARLYASFLFNFGVVPGDKFLEVTGSSLASEGVAGAKKQVASLLNAGGGAFFLDEAYQLALGHNFGGKAVLDYLLAEVENQVGKIIFIFAGYNKLMESFFQHNPGLESRMPYRLCFEDYKDAELLLMLSRLVENKYSHKMKVEGGLNGLYARIVVRRVGRGRGKEGFGNARSLENALAKISDRQANRLRQDRNAGRLPDDFLFTKEDLIGPEPRAAIDKSSAWKDLQALIGLNAVKDAVRSFLDRVDINYQRELQEKPPIDVSLNRVFMGSPGTGKTTVAKLYAQILVDTGLLSNAEVVLKNPADFIGAALGQSEEKTKSILKSTEGKVLIIDEAYMLGSRDSIGQPADPFKTGAVDTIVAEVQSTPGEDRCVLLLGYEEQIRSMFRNTNPGLERRFPLADAFHFEDFDNDQLRDILDFKLDKQDLDATREAKDVAIKVLSKARARLHFGNAGEVENMISHAKGAYQLRQSALSVSERPVDIVFRPEDFDADHDREMRAETNLKILFKDVVGSEDVIRKFEGYIRTVNAMRARGRDPKEYIPFNFIFKGPPGTGKTTIARKIGQMYYDMGFLASTKVHEKSVTDLIAGYVGQTGLKTVEMLDEALGSVLLIDEAYRLGDGNFATDAVDTLVDSLTKPKYVGKILVILAGYEDKMNELLKVNLGLSSRFSDEIVFHNMLPENAFKLLKQKLEKDGIEIEASEDGVGLANIVAIFHALSDLTSWGNGRDVETLAKSIARATFRSANDDANDSFTVSLDDISKNLSSFLIERQARQKTSTLAFRRPVQPQLPMAENMVDSNPLNTVASTQIEISNPGAVGLEEPGKPQPTEPEVVTSAHPTRDLGVPDSIWAQLTLDKVAAATQTAHDTAQLITLSQSMEFAQTASVDIATKLAILQTQVEERNASEELKRRHEEMRLKHLKFLAAQRDAEDRLRQVQEKAEVCRKLEVKVQEKLRCLGVCVAGFRWIKQAGGYRCAGGSHFVGDAQLGLA